MLPRSESPNQRRVRVLHSGSTPNVRKSTSSARVALAGIRRGSSTPQIADYADYTDDADFEIFVFPASIAQCWVSLDVFAMAGVGNAYNFCGC